ncbi:MAG TPA: ATP-binding protein [Streptosporangiaceae bacterium]|nr:ATP-binding protein [Streptosporangiaceae bacterium]
MRDIDSLPDAAMAEPPAAVGLLRHSRHWLRPPWPEFGTSAAETGHGRNWIGTARTARIWVPRSWVRLAWVDLAWVDLAWVALWLLGLAGILIFNNWEAVPFHLIWISFALLYCFRVRTTGARLWVLTAMVMTTCAAIGVDVARGVQPAGELTSAPLMATMFWVMMWHGRRRQAASAESVRVSAENERLLTLQQHFLQDASHQLRTPTTIALGHSELLAKHLVDQQDKRPTADRWWQLGRLDEATVRADRDRLGLAVDALLENAVQHTRRGDTISLSVVGADALSEVRLVVEDAGAGIAPAELGHIFEHAGPGHPVRADPAAAAGPDDIERAGRGPVREQPMIVQQRNPQPRSAAGGWVS